MDKKFNGLKCPLGRILRFGSGAVKRFVQEQILPILRRCRLFFP